MAAPPASRKEWLFRRRGGAIEPLDGAATLQRWIADGRASPEDEYSVDGVEWRVLSSVEKIARLFAKRGNTIFPPSPTEPQAQPKIARVPSLPRPEQLASATEVELDVRGTVSEVPVEPDAATAASPPIELGFEAAGSPAPIGASGEAMTPPHNQTIAAVSLTTMPSAGAGPAPVSQPTAAGPSRPPARRRNSDPGRTPAKKRASDPARAVTMPRESTAPARASRPPRNGDAKKKPRFDWPKEFVERDATRRVEAVIGHQPGNADHALTCLVRLADGEEVVIVQDPTSKQWRRVS